MSVVGIVFGGIHCAGWFFNFPSSDEAVLWRVSSTVVTGIAFLLPLLYYFIVEALLLNGFRLLGNIISVLTIIVICSVTSSFVSGGLHLP